SGGATRGRPELVVVPTGTGRLAWQVAVVAAGRSGGALAPTDGLYYVDATTGDLLTVRPASADGRTPVRLTTRTALPLSAHVTRLAHLARVGGRLSSRDARGSVRGSVQVSGRGPAGERLAAYGVRTRQGVVLVDTTVPTYDASTGAGGIETWDAQGADDTSALPGRRYVERSRNGTTITDPDALAAQAYSRAVYDYYAALGRSSWDSAGGSMVSSVHYGDSSFCNSFFSGSLDPPQMVYGNTCAPGGTPAESTELDIDTAGHEITHGVTDTSAGLIYAGQSGALNESFSDYFGNVIGNLFNGIDTAAVMEDSCFGITDPTFMCQSNPEGTTSVRYLLNGNTFDDYLDVLNPPLRLQQLGLDAQDSGGVHLNSAIWNNALWSIRSRLARMDGTTGNDSELAGAFDRIVYAALTTQLGPTSGFVDARTAVEQAAVAAGADPVILRVAQETFDADRICAGCVDTGPVPGIVVSASPHTELAPSVHGDRITWLDQGDGALGSAASSSVGGAPTSLGTTPDLAQVVFAGDATVVLQYPNGQVPGSVVRYDEEGATNRLGRADRSTLSAGLGGSDDGAAWVCEEDGTVSYVDASGRVSTVRLPDLGGDSVTAVGAGAGTVALGTGAGRVLRWTPGGAFARVGRLDGAVLAVAAYGDRVLAVDDGGSARLFASGGSGAELSSGAIPYGAALGEDYAIWVEGVGDLGGGVAETEGRTYPDGDLYLYSLETGTIYDLMPERGQQGFPALSRDRLVWQDSVFGGDDILTATIPPGL
ncbi:MAG: hypothetical protein JWR90_416, partial [Marmoricola sp.]|nr:hypothetical protein [Marmoricola sp.]